MKWFDFRDGIQPGEGQFKADSDQSKDMVGAIQEELTFFV